MFIHVPQHLQKPSPHPLRLLKNSKEGGGGGGGGEGASVVKESMSQAILRDPGAVSQVEGIFVGKMFLAKNFFLANQKRGIQMLLELVW